MSNPQRELVFARSEGVCQCDGACGEHEGRCTTTITPETFHCSHLRSRAHGGADHETNLQAWCSRCNLVLQSRDARDPRLAPREWQLRELDKIVGAIIRTGAATLSAAPGAGKTVFAGLVFEALRDAGIAERMMAVVPRYGLAEQWTEALVASRHIELGPHSMFERPGQDGIVVTYQSLPNRDRLQTHLLRTRQIPTLLVLDEVHHLARDAEGIHRAWADAIAELAGDVETGVNVAGILNLSGTLWRSDKAERISTVRYSAPDANGKIVSLVDGVVTVEELIRARQLRSIDLYRVDAHVQLEDHAEIKIVDENLSDVDEETARAAVRELADINSWREAFVTSVLDKLEKAHRLTNHYVKALIVAAKQEQARAFRDEVDKQMRARNLQPLATLAISDDPEAQKRLETFRAQKRIGVLCTVDMAGEGYDCPEIAVLGYASNKLTPLYVRQVAARAMRVTDRERELNSVLPAVIVLPDSTKLVETFLSYLGPSVHELMAREELHTQERLDNGEERARDGGGPWMRRFVLTDAQAGAETVTVSFLDGSHEDIDARYAAYLAPHYETANLPELLRPRATAAFQRTVGDLLRLRPFDTFADEESSDRKTTSEPTIEQRAQMLQTQLKKLAGWWAIHGSTPVSHFNRLVNQSAGIGDGKRPSASVDQLDTALKFAMKYVDDHRRGDGGA